MSRKPPPPCPRCHNSDISYNPDVWWGPRYDKYYCEKCSHTWYKPVELDFHERHVLMGLMENKLEEIERISKLGPCRYGAGEQMRKEFGKLREKLHY